VVIEDLAFNAILAVANQALARLADEVDVELPADLRRAAAVTEASLDELWDESAGQYYSRDATSGALIRISTVATFAPLWAAVVPPRRAEALVGLLTGGGFWPRFPVPSVPTDAPQFEPERYWKGPTWVNTNWIAIQGLRRSGATAAADDLARRTIELVGARGCFEYFSPLVGTGFGAGSFSWTAALVLELLDSAALPRSEAGRAIP
jgi:neutral trehalase